MSTLRMIISLGFLALTLYIGITVYRQYLAHAELTGWRRWRAAASDSATMLWGKFTLFVAGIVANLDQFFDAVGMPQVSNAINQYVTPKTAAAVMAMVALGAMLTRKRTL